MDTTATARKLLDQGPISVDELAKAAGVTARSAQRTLADLWQAGQAERRQGTASDGKAGGWTYYRKKDERRAERSARHRLTPKRRKVLDALRAGKWSTTTELRELLGSAHGEPFRLVADLEEMGLICAVGQAKTERGGRAPTIYQAATEEEAAA